MLIFVQRSSGRSFNCRRADTGIMGSSPCIDGTRLRVADIVLLKRFEGLNANEISTYYARPLTVEQVEAALAFYESRRAEIDD